MIALPLARYRFRYVALDDGCFRTFEGSAWRGAFGGALKRVVCAMRLRPCDGCPLLESCIYPHLFEGRQGAAPTRLKSLDRVVVPYVFEADDVVPRQFTRGSEIGVTLTLVGDANRRLAYVGRAMADAGLGGIGPGRARLELREVIHEQSINGGTGSGLHDPFEERSGEAEENGRRNGDDSGIRKLARYKCSAAARCAAAEAA